MTVMENGYEVFEYTPEDFQADLDAAHARLANGDPVKHPKLVLTCDSWPTNGHLILDCVQLGYLHEDWLTLDPTAGQMTWWKQWRPKRLVTSDLDIDTSATWNFDFRDMRFEDGMFDAIAYDPPYCAKGGRKTSGIKDFDTRYGLADAPATPALLQELINDGLKEMARLVRKNGFVLTKCMNYISSGHMWPGVHKTISAAESLGLQLWDQFEHVGSPGPQPTEDRVQRHSRSNNSTLLVLKKKGGTIRY
jgi:hypothetical protein